MTGSLCTSRFVIHAFPLHPSYVLRSTCPNPHQRLLLVFVKVTHDHDGNHDGQPMMTSPTPLTPVKVLRHMLPFRLPPKAAKYGSDGHTCGVDRLVSTGCRFHTTVLSIPPFFASPKLVSELRVPASTHALRLYLFNWTSQRFTSQLPPAPPTEYLHLSVLAYYHLYYLFH